MDTMSRHSLALIEAAWHHNLFKIEARVKRQGSVIRWMALADVRDK